MPYKIRIKLKMYFLNKCILKAGLSFLIISNQVYAGFIPTFTKAATETIAVATTKDLFFGNPSVIQNGELKKALGDLHKATKSLRADLTPENLSSSSTSTYVMLAAFFALSAFKGADSLPMLGGIFLQNINLSKTINPASTVLKFLFCPQIETHKLNHALIVGMLTRAGVRTMFDVFNFKRLIGLLSTKKQPRWLKRFVYHCGILATTYALLEKKWNTDRYHNESISEHLAAKAICHLQGAPLDETKPADKFLKLAAGYTLGTYVVVPFAHELVELATDQLFALPEKFPAGKKDTRKVAPEKIVTISIEKPSAAA